MRPAVRFRVSMLCHASMAGSGTEEGLTINTQLRLFHEANRDLPSIRNSTVRPFSADIGSDNTYTLTDFTMQLVPAHARWVMCSFPRRVANILECYLGSGLILTLPFQGVDLEHHIQRLEAADQPTVQRCS